MNRLSKTPIYSYLLLLPAPLGLCRIQTDPKNRLIEVDDFIAKLWDVHLAVKKEGYVQVNLLEHRHTPSTCSRN